MPSRARHRGQESSFLTLIGLNPLPHLSHRNIAISPLLSGVPTAALLSGMLKKYLPGIPRNQTGGASTTPRPDAGRRYMAASDKQVGAHRWNGRPPDAEGVTPSTRRADYLRPSSEDRPFVLPAKLVE